MRVPGVRHGVKQQQTARAHLCAVVRTAVAAIPRSYGVILAPRCDVRGYEHLFACALCDLRYRGWTTSHASDAKDEPRIPLTMFRLELVSFRPQVARGFAVKHQSTRSTHVCVCVFVRKTVQDAQCWCARRVAVENTRFQK